MTPKNPKRILLIDKHDPRRDTREWLLQQAGYEVVTTEGFDLVEANGQETTFDLVVVSVADGAAGAQAVIYSQRLRAGNPDIPIMALSDNGLYLPKESLIAVMQSGYPTQLIAEVEKLLLESTHIPNNKEPKAQGVEND